MRWVARIVLIVVILIAAVLLWLRTTGPGSDTTLRVAGLTAPVTVERDGYGIATITAANTRDAAVRHSASSTPRSACSKWS